jgi:hypothetical protein
MSEPVDPRRLAAALAMFAAMVEARRDAGDAALCDGLDLLAAEGHGQGRYARAAAAIRGLAPGRPAIDDTRAIDRILKFPPDRRRDAIGIVALDVAGGSAASPQQVHAAACRLRLKLKLEMKDIK